MSVYYVFAIKCTTDNTYYLGVSSKATANSLKYMIDQHKLDNTKYVKLNESIKKNGRNAFMCTRLSTTFSTKEAAEVFVFDKLTSLGDRVLNDTIISPEREKCEKCGFSIKKVFMEAHTEKYCKAIAFAEVDVLFDV